MKIQDLTDAVETCRKVMVEARAPFLAGLLPRIQSGDDLPLLLERLDTISKLVKMRPAAPVVKQALGATKDAAEEILRDPT